MKLFKVIWKKIFIINLRNDYTLKINNTEVIFLPFYIKGWNSTEEIKRLRDSRWAGLPKNDRIQ